MTANRMLRNALNLKGAIVENFSFSINMNITLYHRGGKKIPLREWISKRIEKDAQRNPVAR